jgi:hypothetical protein
MRPFLRRGLHRSTGQEVFRGEHVQRALVYQQRGVPGDGRTMDAHLDVRGPASRNKHQRQRGPCRQGTLYGAAFQERVPGGVPHFESGFTRIESQYEGTERIERSGLQGFPLRNKDIPGGRREHLKTPASLRAELVRRGASILLRAAHFPVFLARLESGIRQEVLGIGVFRGPGQWNRWKRDHGPRFGFRAVTLLEKRRVFDGATALIGLLTPGKQNQHNHRVSKR